VVERGPSLFIYYKIVLMVQKWKRSEKSMPRTSRQPYSLANV